MQLTASFDTIFHLALTGTAVAHVSGQARVANRGIIRPDGLGSEGYIGALPRLGWPSLEASGITSRERAIKIGPHGGNFGLRRAPRPNAVANCLPSLKRHGMENIRPVFGDGDSTPHHSALCSSLCVIGFMSRHGRMEMTVKTSDQLFREARKISWLHPFQGSTSTTPDFG